MEYKLFLDTNALLNLQEAAFKEEFFISQKTLEEIENIKLSGKKDGEVKYKARMVSHLLDEYSGLYTVLLYNSEVKQILSSFDLEETPDNIILATAYLYNKHTPLLVCTDDLNCRFISKKIFNLSTKGSKDINIVKNIDEYTGYKDITLSDEEMSDFYLHLDDNKFDCLVNEYLIIRKSDGDIVDYRRWDGKEYVPLSYKQVNSHFLGKVKPKNPQQILAFDMLQNKNQTIKVISGKFGSGKDYIMIANALKLIEDGKFEILDTIKELQPSDKMQFTLSIAISNDGASNLEKYRTAQASLDIVLGRGGDQAVIHEGDKYTFFGGRTQELEKRNKVKARIIAHALEGLINESSKVIVMGHTNSDMDCVGASMGIYRLSKSLGKDVHIVLNPKGDNLSAFLKELKEDSQYDGVIVEPQTAISEIDDDTLLVVVDTNKKNYVESPELLEKAKKIVVVDHHRRSPDYIENATLTFHEVYASSACELVTELVEYATSDAHLTGIEAEALYAGIMMDTKTFTFKTGVRTFEAAAYLRKCGVDIIKVKKWFQSDFDTYNKISNIIGKAELVYDTIAISIYDEDDPDSNVICAKAADELLTISNITASFVIGKLDNKVCISGRSIGDINVQVILEKLGGGGHITLAGAQVEGMDTQEVKQELINRINEYFSEQI